MISAKPSACFPQLPRGIGDEAPWAPKPDRATGAYPPTWTTTGRHLTGGAQTSVRKTSSLCSNCTVEPKGARPFRYPSQGVHNSTPPWLPPSAAHCRVADPLPGRERRRLSSKRLRHYHSHSGYRRPPSEDLARDPLNEPRVEIGGRFEKTTFTSPPSYLGLAAEVQYCTRLAVPESQPQYARPDLVPVSSLPPVHGRMADLMPSGERRRR